jgi:hypothetical protein
MLKYVVFCISISARALEMTPIVCILYDFAFLIVVRIRLSKQDTADGEVECLKCKKALKAFATSNSDN